MKKTTLGLILIITILITTFYIHQQEVLSNIVEPEGIGYVEENIVEVIVPELPEPSEPSEPQGQEGKTVEKPNDDLTYAEVVAFIDQRDKKMVVNPKDVLVLVNKENNLSATYVPEDLIIPNVPFSFEGYSKKKYMRQEAATALEELIMDAQGNGHLLHAVSGYRSYETQRTIFLGNVERRGFKKANGYSAIPGQSEHQTGLAMDLSVASVNYSLIESFGKTPEGIWLRENAHLYGFIIRYPANKVHITGYQYEPWHIRYVGIEIATEITEKKLTLEEYIEKANQPEETTI